MTDENSFIDHLRKFNDKNWIEVYFDLIAEVIDTTGLRSDDPRIVTSVVRSDAYFPVTINNRYVLASSKHYDNAFIICQREFHNREDLHSGVSYYFNQLPGERANNDVPPILVIIDKNLIIEPELRSSIYGWRRTLIIEANRAKGSPYKKYHNPYVYKAAKNKDYRANIFGLVFN